MSACVRCEACVRLCQNRQRAGFCVRLCQAGFPLPISRWAIKVRRGPSYTPRRYAWRALVPSVERGSAGAGRGVRAPVGGRQSVRGGRVIGNEDSLFLGQTVTAPPTGEGPKRGARWSQDRRFYPNRFWGMPATGPSCGRSIPCSGWITRLW